MITRTLATPVHGRYLIEERDSDRLLVGFHGYAETAEGNLDELLKIPGTEAWSVVAVQALHPFYTKKRDVVASWMTRLDRELAIADNVAWVRAVLAALPEPKTLVFAGFSQGAAMAARAAARIRPCHGAILLGADVPPDVKGDPDVAWPPVLLARGSDDDSYPEEKFKEDLSFLEQHTRVNACRFAGGHEWTPEFREAAGEFLRSVATNRAG